MPIMPLAHPLSETNRAAAPYACQSYTHGKPCRYDKRPDDAQCETCYRESDLQYISSNGVDISRFCAEIPDVGFRTGPIPAFDVPWLKKMEWKRGRSKKRAHPVIWFITTREGNRVPYMIQIKDTSGAVICEAENRGRIVTVGEVVSAIDGLGSTMAGKGWEPC